MEKSTRNTEQKVSGPTITLKQITKEREILEKRFAKNFSELQNAYSQLDEPVIAMVADGRPAALASLEILKIDISKFFATIQEYSLEDKENNPEGQKSLAENQLRVASLLEQAVFIECYAKDINEKRQQEAIKVLKQWRIDLAKANTEYQEGLTKLQADIDALEGRTDIIPVPEFLNDPCQSQHFQSVRAVSDSKANNTLAVSHATCFRFAAEQFSHCGEYLSQRKELVKLAMAYLQLVKEMEGYSEKVLPPEALLQKDEQKEKQRKLIDERFKSFTERRFKLIDKLVKLKPKLETSRKAIPAILSQASPEQKALLFIQEMLQTTHKKFAAYVKSIAQIHELQGLVVDVTSPTAEKEVLTVTPLPTPLYKDKAETKKWEWGGISKELDTVDIEDAKEEQRVESELDKNLVRYDQALENFQFASLVQSKEKRRDSELVAPLSHSRSASMSVSTPDPRSNSPLKPSTVDDSKTQSDSIEVAEGKAVDTSGAPAVEGMEEDELEQLTETRQRGSAVNLTAVSSLKLPAQVAPPKGIGTEDLSFFNDIEGEGVTASSVSISSSPAMPQAEPPKNGSPKNGERKDITSPPGSSFPRVSQMPAVGFHGQPGGAENALPKRQLEDPQFGSIAAQGSEREAQFH
jgi:hypothetical protein